MNNINNLNSLNLVKGSVAPFSPGSIANWKIGLDASRETGYSDGGAMQKLIDFTGGGNDYTQGTGASQPLYKTNIQNGKPSCRFDGIDDALANLSYNFVNGFTMFATLKSTGITGGFGRYISFNNGTAIIYEGAGRYGGNGIAWDVDSGFGHINLGGDVTSACVVMIQATNNNIDIFINNTRAVATFNGWTNPSGSPLILGAQSAAGASAGNIDLFQVDIYERALTTTEINTYARNVGAKWGITVA